MSCYEAEDFVVRRELERDSVKSWGRNSWIIDVNLDRLSVLLSMRGVESLKCVKVSVSKAQRDEARLLWLADDGFMVDESRIMRVWEGYQPY